jgi:dipeptide transport system permease protein
MGISLTGYSMPIFWWGLLLILLFSVKLDLTPVSGRISVQYFIEPTTGFLLIDSAMSDQKGAFLSSLSHLILPTVSKGQRKLMQSLSVWTILKKILPSSRLTSISS